MNGTCQGENSLFPRGETTVLATMEDGEEDNGDGGRKKKKSKDLFGRNLKGRTG